MNNGAWIFLVGAGATAATDIWSIVRKRAFGIAPPNYRLVGRWIAGFASGRFRAAPITASPAVRGEHALGWAAHYAIGFAFTTLLPALWGSQWMDHPTPAPALMLGIGTVIAPLFVMQPAMGSPRQSAARLQSLVTHTIFGLGLYLVGLLVSKLLSGE